MACARCGKPTADQSDSGFCGSCQQVVELSATVDTQRKEIEQLRELVGRVVVAYHLVKHAGAGPGRLYGECQEPFCVEARALGLPNAKAAEASIDSEEGGE